MEPAIGKLLDASGKVVGTAFAVSSSRVLTAFHCIGDIETGKVWRKRVLLEFRTGDQIVGVYEAGRHFEDYAILSLQSPLPPESLAPVPLFDEAYIYEPFRAVGYPVSAHQSDDPEIPDIRTVGGQVMAVDASIWGGAPTIQLYSHQSAAGLSLHGMSGAPVLVGRNPEGAVGLVRWNYPRKDAPELGEGGDFWACPVKLIIEQQSEYADLVLCARVVASTPREEKIAGTLAVLRSTQPGCGTGTQYAVSHDVLSEFDLEDQMGDFSPRVLAHPQPGILSLVTAGPRGFMYDYLVPRMRGLLKSLGRNPMPPHKVWINISEGGEIAFDLTDGNSKPFRDQLVELADDSAGDTIFAILTDELTITRLRQVADAFVMEMSERLLPYLQRNRVRFILVWVCIVEPPPADQAAACCIKPVYKIPPNDTMEWFSSRLQKPELSPEISFAPQDIDCAAQTLRSRLRDNRGQALGVFKSLEEILHMLNEGSL